MTPSLSSLQRCLARVFRESDGTPIGAAFLASDRLLCTCAHVVFAAIGSDARGGAELSVSFPFLDEGRRKARLVRIDRIDSDNRGDVAVLELVDGAPTGASPCLLDISSESFRPRRTVATYGFPAGHPQGVPSSLETAGVLSNEWLEATSDGETLHLVAGGFSGAPVVDPKLGSVIGMVAAVEDIGGKRVVYLIQSRALARAEPTFQTSTSREDSLPLAGMSELGPARRNVERFLDHYLGTEDSPTGLGGRHDSVELLDRWHASPGSQQGLLVADAGRGKSALMVRWAAHIAERSRVVFVPISWRFETSSKLRTLTILACQLRALAAVTTALPQCVDDLSSEIYELLQRSWNDGERGLTVILDGMDEASQWDVANELPLGPRLGRGVKVLVTARRLGDCDAEGWRQRLDWHKPFVMDLPPLDLVGTTEALALAAGDGSVAARTAAEVHRLSQGEPLLVRLYAAAIAEEGSRGLEAYCDNVPGLDAYLTRQWERQKDAWGAQADRAQVSQDAVVVRSVLARAMGALPLGELVELCRSKVESAERVAAAVSGLRQLVVGDARAGYAFFHPRLAKHFSDALSPLDRAGVDDLFVRTGLRCAEALAKSELLPEECADYWVLHLGAHLRRSEAPAREHVKLMTAGWLRASVVRGDSSLFIDDCARAFATLERQRDVSGAERLRFDLRIIAARARAIDAQGPIPPTLLGQLVRLGGWSFARANSWCESRPNEQERAAGWAELAKVCAGDALPELIAEIPRIAGVRDAAVLVRALGQRAWPALLSPIQRAVFARPGAEANDLWIELLRVLSLVERDVDAEVTARLFAPGNHRTDRLIFAAAKFLPCRARALAELREAPGVLSSAYWSLLPFASFGPADWSWLMGLIQSHESVSEPSITRTKRVARALFLTGIARCAVDAPEESRQLLVDHLTRAESGAWIEACAGHLCRIGLRSKFDAWVGELLDAGGKSLALTAVAELLDDAQQARLVEGVLKVGNVLKFELVADLAEVLPARRNELLEVLRCECDAPLVSDSILWVSAGCKGFGPDERAGFARRLRSRAAAVQRLADIATTVDDRTKARLLCREAFESRGRGTISANLLLLILEATRRAGTSEAPASVRRMAEDSTGEMNALTRLICRTSSVQATPPRDVRRTILDGARGYAGRVLTALAHWDAIDAAAPLLDSLDAPSLARGLRRLQTPLRGFYAPYVRSRMGSENKRDRADLAATMLGVVDVTKVFCDEIDQLLEESGEVDASTEGLGVAPLLGSMVPRDSPAEDPARDTISQTNLMAALIRSLPGLSRPAFVRTYARARRFIRGRSEEWASMLVRALVARGEVAAARRFVRTRPGSHKSLVIDLLAAVPEGSAPEYLPAAREWLSAELALPSDPLRENRAWALIRHLDGAERAAWFEKAISTDFGASWEVDQALVEAVVHCEQALAPAWRAGVAALMSLRHSEHIWDGLCALLPIVTALHGKAGLDAVRETLEDIASWQVW